MKKLIRKKKEKIKIKKYVARKDKLGVGGKRTAEGRERCKKKATTKTREVCPKGMKRRVRTGLKRTKEYTAGKEKRKKRERKSKNKERQER